MLNLLYYFVYITNMSIMLQLLQNVHFLKMNTVYNIIIHDIIPWEKPIHNSYTELHIQGVPEKAGTNVCVNISKHILCTFM